MVVANWVTAIFNLDNFDELGHSTKIILLKCCF